MIRCQYGRSLSRGTAERRRCVQCKEEIGRLEVEMAKQMRVIIQNNVAVVRSLCAETELPVPDLSSILSGADAENAVAGVLQKINSAVIALRAVLETREPVLRAAREVEEGFREAHWHFVHQQDNLFNNRVRTARHSLANGFAIVGPRLQSFSKVALSGLWPAFILRAG